MGITLQQLLDSRDNRRRRQLELMEQYKDSTLVLLTIVMPGSEKRNHLSLTAAKAASLALKKSFDGTIVHYEANDLVTGYEAFMVTSVPPEEAKLKACEIEDNHPLGRLFDIDVMKGTPVPVSRTRLNLPPRRCLICGDDARVCMRAGRHDYGELLARITSMIESYDES